MRVKTLHSVMLREDARARSNGRMSGAAGVIAAGAMTVAGFLVNSAYAQAPAPQSAAEQLDEVVVTSSRIARTGFTAPTPTTVLGQEEIERRAPNAIGETLNELPAFRMSTSPQTTGNFPGNGVAQTQADLRGLGSVRSLVLVNGRRHVATATNGSVDLGLIPAVLVERAEVVTGGASAAWGSDAVAGVVNLILKNKLQGIEVSGQYGVTDHDDDETWKVGIAAGTGFAGERGHVMIGGEFSDGHGVRPLNGLNSGSRDWLRNWGTTTNTGWNIPGAPGFGLPATIYGENLQLATQTRGGLITGVPAEGASLLGLAFNPDGSTHQFQPGVNYGDVFMLGGEQPGINIGYNQYLKPPIQRYSALSHADYELTDSVSAFAEVSVAEVKTHDISIVPFTFGVPLPPTIPAAFFPVPPTGGISQFGLIARTENPFMPAALRNQMQALGVPAVFLGRFNEDVGNFVADVSNQTQRYVVGLDGKLGGKGNWTWDTYYQYGRNTENDDDTNTRRTSYFDKAIDVVTNPANGQPVCRSTLTNPTDGCVPFNIFGQGASSEAARNYVQYDTWTKTLETQQVAAVNLRGDLFQLSTGPVSLATGAEWRREELAQSADPILLSGDTNLGTSLFNPANGSLSVKEVYAELVTPLVKDAAFAKGVDLDLAGRFTDYSSSGGVTTWKAGLTWDVNDQVRFRGSVSRDIRAANVNELYAADAYSLFVAVDRIDPSKGAAFVNLHSGGNPNLDPEKGTTYTGGVVYQSPGRAFRTSVDYYRIEIKDQITTVAGQDIVDHCAADIAAGNSTSTSCSAIHRDITGTITDVDSPFVNLIGFRTSGVDFEASYTRPLTIMPGTISLRGLVNYTHELTRIDEHGEVNRAGQMGGFNGVPDWQANLTLGYSLRGFSGSAQVRFFNRGVIDVLAIPGTATSANVYTVPSEYLVNLSASYNFSPGANGRKTQVFAVVDNAMDSHPPFPVSNSPYYDQIGRAYRVGVRMKF